MDPITAVGLAASIVQLITAAGKTAQCVNEIVEAPKELLDFAQEASNLLSLLYHLRNRVQESQGQDGPWVDSMAALGGKDGLLDQLRVALTRVADKLAGAKRFGRRMLWPLYKNDILAILARIERLKTDINRALQSNVESMVRIISKDTSSLPGLSQGISGIQASIDKQTSQKIIEWLSPISFSAIQKETLQKRENGTSTWILEDPRFKEWSVGSGGVLCCQGIPGSGKTILASVVTDHLQGLYSMSEDTQVACVFCRHNERDLQSPVNMIASLWRQLVSPRKPLSSDVRETYTMNQDQGTRPSLDEVFGLLEAEVKRQCKVFMIVDALDEYSPEQGSRQILTEKLGKLRPKVDFMITSRNFEDDLAKEYSFHGIQISAREQDIHKYVTGRIQREKNLRGHVLRDKELMAAISKTIINRSKGMFLMAKLHMDSLSQKRTPITVRTLEHLPDKLDNTYREALLRIDNQHVEDREMANSVLAWLCHAKRPLTIQDLQHVLSLDGENVEPYPDRVMEQDILLSICAGLVTVDPGSGIVRMVHYTTQEFFEKIRCDRFPDADHEIITSCLRYLSSSALDGYCRKSEDLEIRLRSHPFLTYAAVFWGHHLRGSCEKIMSDQVLEFLAKKNKIACVSQILLLLVCRVETYPTTSVQKVSGLNLASYFGLDHIVNLLLERSALVPGKASKVAYVDSYDQNYGTVLHWAVLGNNTITLSRLLAQEGTQSLIGVVNCFESTALLEAAKCSRLQSMKLLLNGGADVLQCGNNYSLSPLHEAAKNGRVETIRVLLDTDKKQELLEQRVHEGQAALHIAASRNNYQATKVLLDSGASLLIQDRYWKTPLHTAVDRGANRTVELLLDRECTVSHLSIISQARKNAFQSACMLGHTEVASLFLRQKVKVQLLKCDSLKLEDCLLLAAARGQAATVELLFNHCQDALYKHDCRIALLHAAVGSGDLATARLLTNMEEYRKILSISVRCGWTSVHQAARLGHAEILELLLAHGADLETEDSNGQTALHYAAEKGLDTVVDVLLSAGVNLEVNDQAGRTPLLLALNARSSLVAGLLLKKGASRRLLKDLNDSALRVWIQRQPWASDHSEQGNTYRKPYEPSTARDVFHAYFCLQNTPLRLSSDTGVVVRQILEMAQYWIKSKAIHDEALDFTMHDGDFIYLRSRPIVGRAISPVQRIVCETISKDQGWSNDKNKGTYAGSYTWFDIGRQRAGKKVNPFVIIKNIHAGQDLKTHTVFWTPHGQVDEKDNLVSSHTRKSDHDISEWIQDLLPGDRIVIVPKALYEGWTNHVARVELTVYTSSLFPDVQSRKRLIPGLQTTTQQAFPPLRSGLWTPCFRWGASSAEFDVDISARDLTDERNDNDL